MSIPSVGNLRFVATPESGNPYIQHYEKLFHKHKAQGRRNLFKQCRDQLDDMVRLEEMRNRLIIWGTPDKVADDLLAFCEETGDFGTLLCAGKG